MLKKVEDIDPFYAPNSMLLEFFGSRGISVSNEQPEESSFLTLERLEELGYLTSERKLREALKDLEVAKNFYFDFEVSYTQKFMDHVASKVGKISHHIVLPYLAKLSFDFTRDVDIHSDFPIYEYRPQWMLGFVINSKYYAVTNCVLDELEDPDILRRNSQVFLARLRQCFKQKLFIGQNLKYDLKLLADLFDFAPGDILDMKAADLMLMAFILNTERRRYSLSVLADDFLPKTEDGLFYKIGNERIGVSWKESEEFHRTALTLRFEETSIYNYKDIKVTEALYKVLRAKIYRNDASVAFDIYKWFVPLYTAIEYSGVCIDRKKARKLLADKRLEAKQSAFEAGKLLEGLLEKCKGSPGVREKFLSNLRAYILNKSKKLEKDSTEEEIDAVLKKAFPFFSLEDFSLDLNLDYMLKNNVREFIGVLIQTFGLPVTRTPKGSLAFQRETLSAIENALKNRLEEPSEEEETLKEIVRKIVIVNSSKANLARIAAFGQLPSLVYGGRLHSEFKLTGTSTGRISSVRPGIMNMPKMIKALIYSDLGKISQIDLSAAEAKLYVNTIQLVRLIKKLLKGGDVYSLIGKEVLMIEISKKTRPTERNIMKVGILAKMYGQSPSGLSKILRTYYEPKLNEILPEPIPEEETPEQMRERLLKDKKKKKEYPFIYEWDVIDFERNRLNYDLLAEKIVERFEERLTSKEYESWVVENLFNYEEPKKSYVRNQLGHRRYFDMSPSSLFAGHLDSGGHIEADYALLYAFFKKFFLEDEVLPVTSFFYDAEKDTFVKKESVARKHFALYAAGNALKKTYTKFQEYQKFQQKWLDLRDFWLKNRDFIGLPFYRFVACSFKAYREKDLKEIADDFDLYNSLDLSFPESSYLEPNYFNFAVSLSKTAAPDLRDLPKLYTLLDEGMERKVFWPMKHLFSLFSRETIEVQGSQIQVNKFLRKVVFHKPSVERLMKGFQVLAARYREALNFPMQGTSSFVNSKFVYTTWKRCLDQGLNVLVSNTIHDAGIYEHTAEETSEFSKVVDSVYSDPKVIKPLLEESLKKLHKTDKIVLAPIGGELEVADYLDEVK